LFSTVRRAALGLSIACAFLSSRAHGQSEPVVLSTATTVQLAQICNDTLNALRPDFCTGYVLAVFDTLSLGRDICPSRSVTTVQVMAVARRLLNERPDQWDLAPAHLLSARFRSAFPCAR
jgi:hypothetical protein